MTDRRIIIDVDARGRVSLARFGIKDTQVVVDHLPDGDWRCTRRLPSLQLKPVTTTTRRRKQRLNEG